MPQTRFYKNRTFKDRGIKADVGDFLWLMLLRSGVLRKGKDVSLYYYLMCLRRLISRIYLFHGLHARITVATCDQSWLRSLSVLEFAGHDWFARR